MWIRFHDTLRKGKKRGLPRAARFIYLELASEARPLRGVVELPVGMSFDDGLHDVLGGDRRELLRLFPLLTVSGTDGEEPMVVVEGAAGAWRIVIPSWDRWNGGDDSADRVRAHRARQKTGSEQDQQLGSACNALHPVSVTEPVTPLEESRSDQIPPRPPQGGKPETQGSRAVGQPAVAQPPLAKGPTSGPPHRPHPETKGSPGEQAVLPLGTEAEGKRSRGRRKQPETTCPAGWIPRPAEVTKAREYGFDDKRIRFEVEKFQNHHRAKGNTFADWDAAFRNWLLKAKHFQNETDEANGPKSEVKANGADVIAKMAALRRAEPT